jgi:hypothetical protein
MSRLSFISPVEAMALYTIMSAPASAQDNGSGQTVPTPQTQTQTTKQPVRQQTHGETLRSPLTLRSLRA